MCAQGNRRQTDLVNLMMKDFKVETINDSINSFNVEFKGPQDSLYQGGVWMVRVDLPDDYPYKSPSIRFVNKIYHPNVAEGSGCISLNVLKKNWSAMFDLVNVFEIFLPQLLLYPNPEHPFNIAAGHLMLRNRDAYDQKVKEYCIRYAKEGDLIWKQEEKGSEDISDNESEEMPGDEEMTADEEMPGDKEMTGPANP